MARASAIYKATWTPMVSSRLTGVIHEFSTACHRLRTPVVSIVRRRLFGRHVRLEIHYPRSRSDSISFRFAAMKPALLPLVLAASFVACQQRGTANMTTSEQKAIADSLRKLVVNAYDLSKPDPVKSLMSLYPDTGRVVSASGGVVTTSRPQLEQGIKVFWTYVGQNMRNT